VLKISSCVGTRPVPSAICPGRGQVTRIDRLARSVGDLQEIVRQVKAPSASLKAREQPIDTSTAAGKCFLDIELTAPDLDQACFNHPALPPGTVASNGPADDCVVDKIEEFAKELANPATDLEEQVAALKFLLHFVGDVHQPLHASDDNDRGGNNKKLAASWIKAGHLHHYWDTEFVALLETDAKSIASDLIGHISKDQQKQWQRGSPSDWAKDSFQIAKTHAYGLLSEPSARGSYGLSDEYVKTATADVALQLSKAGVRLAFLLNNALRKH